MRAGQVTKCNALGAAVLAGVLAAQGAACRAADAPLDATEAKFTAGRLVEEAREVLVDTSLSPTDAARGAAILLQFANKLDSGDVRTLKMLAETARAAGDVGLRKDTLRAVMKLDPGDLVAQVQYLDLLAGATEEMEERARIYQSALDQAALDPQVKSEMAARLAQIADERGLVDEEKKFLNDAVALNNVNVPALRSLVRLAARNPRAVAEQLDALVTLLSADPYQPDAWLQMARICERVNMHDRAGDCLKTALEQMQWQGVAPSGELYQEMAMEFAIAGRTEAPQIAGGLARLPDVPLSALALAELASDAPGATPLPASTQSADETVSAKIEKLLAEMVKKGEQAGGSSQADALADAAGVELTIMPQVGPDAGNWVDEYAKLVAPDDATLGRLRGWQLYRDRKLDEARAALEKEAASDPMAQVGLARVLIDQGKKDEAARQLQDIWSSHPTDLLALQVAQTARRGQITLADTILTKQLTAAAARLSPGAMTAHREPRENVLITALVRKNMITLGEPATVSIRMTNVAEKALPVGAGGGAVALTTIGLAASMRGGDAASPGFYGLEELQRVYRLEPQGVIDATIRADQGKLSALLGHDPTREVVVDIAVATAPRVDAKNEMVPGLGGQLIQAGQVRRIGWTWDPVKLPQELLGADADARLAKIQAVGDMLALTAASSTGEADANAEKSKASISVLQPLAKSDDPLVRAAILRALPASKSSEEVEKVVDSLSSDPDSLVRLSWATRAGMMAQRGDSAMAAALEKRSGEEKDPLVKQWMELQGAKKAATRPAP